MSKGHHSINFQWEERRGRKHVTLSGRLDSDATLSILFLDEKGRLRMQKKYGTKSW